MKIRVCDLLISFQNDKNLHMQTNLLCSAGFENENLAIKTLT